MLGQRCLASASPSRKGRYREERQRIIVVRRDDTIAPETWFAHLAAMALACRLFRGLALAEAEYVFPWRVRTGRTKRIDQSGEHARLDRLDDMVVEARLLGSDPMFLLPVTRNTDDEGVQ